jgi:hypothetical protein
VAIAYVAAPFVFARRNASIAGPVVVARSRAALGLSAISLLTVLSVMLGTASVLEGSPERPAPRPSASVDRALDVDLRGDVGPAYLVARAPRRRGDPSEGGALTMIDPPRARLRVDGDERVRAIAPFTSVPLARGAHDLELELPGEGRRVWLRDLRVDDGAQLRIVGVGRTQRLPALRDAFSLVDFSVDPPRPFVREAFGARPWLVRGVALMVLLTAGLAMAIAVTQRNVLGGIVAVALVVRMLFLIVLVGA